MIQKCKLTYSVDFYVEVEDENELDSLYEKMQCSTPEYAYTALTEASKTGNACCEYWNEEICEVPQYPATYELLNFKEIEDKWRP